MEELMIFPYSGTAIEALDCLGDKWKCIGFISDDELLIGKEDYGIKIYGRQALQSFSNAKILAVHGSPASYRNRVTTMCSLDIAEERFALVIHEKASVSSHAKIGFNVLIMAGVVITANAEISNHVVVLPNSVIHHDSKIGAYTLVAANVTVAGNVTIGENCYIGAASSIKNGITIGKASMIGIGANVIHSYPEKSILVGNPARSISTSA
jgi:sugar O-acyltransferase (sialic acid O-acetyltransferase NeuD family)